MPTRSSPFNEALGQYHRGRETHDCNDLKEFHFDGRNNSKGPSFDLASWIQQGAVCRNSCRNQCDYEVRCRATSFSSNTSSTQNSSLNDSFEDDINISLDGLRLDSIYWNTTQEGKDLCFSSFLSVCTLPHRDYLLPTASASQAAF